MVFYGAGFALWLVILKLYPLSLAFPIAAGSLIVASQFIGIYLLNESLRLTNILGIFLIIAGMFLVYYGRSHG
jgi:multidrug transporter EmrE-like cation transporter